MKMSEAKRIVSPYITGKLGAEWAMLDTDHSLWVEHNIMGPAGIESSITSQWGLALADWIEVKLEDIYIKSVIAE